MKKVKIMLTAVVVMAVVGGALAFKVKKSTGEQCLYTTTTTTTINGNPVGTCQAPVVVTDQVLTDIGATKFATIRDKNGLGQCPQADLNCINFSTTTLED